MIGSTFNDGRTEGESRARALPWMIFALILVGTFFGVQARRSGLAGERDLYRDLSTQNFVLEVDDVRTRLSLEQQKLSFLIEGTAAAINAETSAEELATVVRILPIGDRVPAVTMIAFVEREGSAATIVAAVDQSGNSMSESVGVKIGGDGQLFGETLRASADAGTPRIGALELNGQRLFGLTMPSWAAPDRSVLITFIEDMFLSPALGEPGGVGSVLVPPEPSPVISVDETLPFDGNPTLAGSIEVAGDQVKWSGIVDVFGSEWALFSSSESDFLSVPRSREPVLIGLLGFTIAVGTLLLMRYRLRRIEAAAREAVVIDKSNRRFSTGFDNAPVGMAILDRDGQIVRYNTALARQLGRSRDSLVGTRLHDFLQSVEIEAMEGVFATLADGTAASAQRDLRYLRDDGSVLSVSESISALNRHTDADRQYLVHSADNSADRAVEQALRHQALHDALTGLPNRAHLLEQVASALEATIGTGDEVALMFIDLDRFKVVNDSLGHGAGDEVIQILADRLRVAINGDHFLARFGGDEFVLVCRGEVEAAAVNELADLVRDEVGRPIVLEGTTVHVTASVGITIGNGDQDTPEGLIRDADAAMYKAKDRGRNRAEHFEAGIRDAAVARLDLEQRLRQAIDNDDFGVHYQPVVDLTSGHVVGFEALLRWEHPDRGLIPPGEFLGVAEEAGLLDDIDRLTLSRACRQFTDWSQRSEIAANWHLAVNCSPRWLHEGVVAELLPSLLAESKLDPTRLWLEVTETALLRDNFAAAASFEGLHDLGVRIAIDDFGTGFSSLSYLSRFNVDRLKIDQSFVQSLGVSQADNAIVAAVIEMASALGISSVAEGTESAEQLRILRELGADFAQGFLLSKPLSSSEIERALITAPAAP